MPTTETSASRLVAAGRAIAASVAVWLPLLAGAGWVANAATTASAAPVFVSVTTTGPDASGGDTPTSLPTPAPQAAAVVDVPAVSGGAGASAGSVEQTIAVSILPGPLTITPVTETMDLSQLRGFDRGLSFYRGQLSPVTVVDARGSLVGWRASVSLQGVAGASAAELARARLCASARAPTMVAGNLNDVVRRVPLSCAGVGGTVSVFFAAPQGGGGTFSDTADLTLLMPGGTLPAQVTASLAVAVH